MTFYKDFRRSADLKEYWLKFLVDTQPKPAVSLPKNMFRLLPTPSFLAPRRLSPSKHFGTLP